MAKKSYSKVISAFAFKTGKLIENIIKEETNNLKETNMYLEAKILGYRNLISKGNNEQLEEFDKWFDIIHSKEGKI